ncbi:hypothetical protein KP79_PYT06999 [Mizuhopecten yessoensis]|uniref:Uncharacterized protein n=1 Tax=Mizuhopecten yessoensis TaxID=6573 RepID=A0A210QWP0_MIZYE|nr:hypothetical protein KP79_PYT06999 [Mizuhopecten yessoensis]
MHYDMMKGLQKNETVNFLHENKKMASVETRINPEISKAIKRQKETNGVEYWKSSPNPKGLQGPQKRTTFDKIHNLKFEFPNGVLPAIPSPSQRLQPFKSSTLPTRGSRKKGLPVGLEAMNRSYNMQVSHSKDVGGHLSPKKASVTDLTCLQLADTLFSHPDQVSPGLYGFSVGKIRYMDYIMESMKTRDELEKENSFHEHFPSVKIPLREGRAPLPPVTGSDAGQTVDLRTGEVLFTGGLLNTGRVSNRRNTSPSERFMASPELRSEDIVIVENTKDVKRRSILKPSKQNLPPKDYPEAEREKNVLSNDHRTCNESPNARVVHSSMNPYRHGSPFDPSQCITITSHPPRNGNGLSGCGISVLTANNNGYLPNRSVRFSVSDEIHEYLPSEPICY